MKPVVKAVVKPTPKPVVKPTPKPVVKPKMIRVDHRPAVAAAHAEQLLDAQIAERIGVPVTTAARIRRSLQLPANRRPKKERVPAVHVEPAWIEPLQQLHAARRTDQEIAEALGIDRPTAARRRRRLGLPANVAERTHAPWADHHPAVARLHALERTDAEIADELKISISRAGTLRRDLNLKAHRSKRTRWDGVELQPCGTNAAYVRGCECDACDEAHRAYHRAYVARRRAEAIPAENHGTAYGYQLGCHDRAACPAHPTCSDASIAEERRRRREAGIPEQAPRVDAQPVRDHVRSLMSAGRSVQAIAAEAEVSLSGLKTLLYGRSGARKGEIPANIEQRKAERLLAVA